MVSIRQMAGRNDKSAFRGEIGVELALGSIKGSFGSWVINPKNKIGWQDGTDATIEKPKLFGFVYESPPTQNTLFSAELARSYEAL